MDCIHGLCTWETTSFLILLHTTKKGYVAWVIGLSAEIGWMFIGPEADVWGQPAFPTESEREEAGRMMKELTWGQGHYKHASKCKVNRDSECGPWMGSFAGTETKQILPRNPRERELPEVSFNQEGEHLPYDCSCLFWKSNARNKTISRSVLERYSYNKSIRRCSASKCMRS